MKKKIIILSAILAFVIIVGLFFLPKSLLTDFKGMNTRLFNIDVVRDENPRYNVVRIQGDYLTFAGSPTTVEPYADKLISFSDWLKGEQIPFLFVQTPHKVGTTVTALADGTPNFFKADADEMLERLDAHGVPTFDLRKEIDSLDYFFKTDHHWTPQAGLLAARLIGDQLNQDFDFEIDTTLYDQANFNYETIPKSLLGSQGKKVGRLYAGVDDFTIITPKFQTNMQKIVPIMGIDVKGDFATCFSDKSLIENIDVYKSSPYPYYTGDYNIEINRNFALPQGKKLLIIRDSFGCVLTPFMALGLNELHVMDARFYKEDVYKYIQDNAIDMVIFESNPGYNNTQFMFVK